jgi:hypothetical protein
MKTLEQRKEEYLEELVQVGRRHGFSLSHEDQHGAFEVTVNWPVYENWLRNALISRQLEKSS